MQFIVIGRDGTDPQALDRRMAARPAHVALCDEMAAKGQQLLGFALVDDTGKMNGSVMVFDMPDRAALDEWMTREPYISGKVWDTVEVSECRTGPTFTAAIEKLKAK